MQTTKRVFYYSILPFIAGILYSLGFPQKDFFYHMALAHIGVFAFFFQLSHLSSFKKQLLSFFCYSLGYNLVGYYWIPETIREFGNIVFPVNYLLGTLFSLIILPHVFIYIMASSFIGRRYQVLRTPLFYACLLTTLEYVIPQQFPAHLGHTWLELVPYLGLAKYFGANIYSFISYFFIFSLIDSLNTKQKRPLSRSLILLVPLVAFSVVKPLSQNVTDQLRVRLVQANIGNLLKLSSEKGHDNADRIVFNRYKNLSLKAPVQKKPRLIIWPETAYPELLVTKFFSSPESSRVIPQTIQDVTKQSQAYLFTGGYDRALGNGHSFFETQYNSALYFSPESTFLGVYHKAKLIPFGESLPFGPLNQYLVNLNPNIAFFAKGMTKPIFTIDQKYRFMAAICYEVLFSSYIRDYLSQANSHPHFMINLTNDSWYGDTAEPYQHKFLAHWRALEFQLPIIRMTNTGISNILYQDGSESHALFHNQEDILDLDLNLSMAKPTLFQHYGFLPLLGLFVIFYLINCLLEAFFNKVMQPKKP